jgi:hypothetical protein
MERETLRELCNVYTSIQIIPRRNVAASRATDRKISG